MHEAGEHTVALLLEGLLVEQRERGRGRRVVVVVVEGGRRRLLALGRLDHGRLAARLMPAAAAQLLERRVSGKWRRLRRRVPSRAVARHGERSDTRPQLGLLRLRKLLCAGDGGAHATSDQGGKAFSSRGRCALRACAVCARGEGWFGAHAC